MPKRCQRCASLVGVGSRERHVVKVELIKQFIREPSLEIRKGPAMLGPDLRQDLLELLDLVFVGHFSEIIKPGSATDSEGVPMDLLETRL